MVGFGSPLVGSWEEQLAGSLWTHNSIAKVRGEREYSGDYVCRYVTFRNAASVSAWHTRSMFLQLGGQKVIL